MHRAPRWMRAILCAAGVYNVVWGTWVVSFPGAFFNWLGVPASNYLPIWQCVGMLVGVYGIGYLIAARDLFRYWPMVLVGLLGKILGPAGMAWSVAHSDLPARIAWTCLPNDLVWWGPFALILCRIGMRAAKAKKS